MGSWNYPVAGREPLVAQPRYMQKGTSPVEWWYSSDVTAEGNGTVTMPLSEIWLMWFLVGRRVLLDRMAIDVAVGSTLGVARIGIYKPVSDSNLIPSALVLDAGEVSTGSTGQKVATVSKVLYPGLYYLAVLCGTDSPDLSGARDYNSLSIGRTSNFNPLNVYKATQVYGALPAVCPAGTATNENIQPVVLLRRSG